VTLRSRIRVGTSPIHGRGVFARTRIRDGACIGDFEGSKTTRNGMHVLWTLDENGREIGIRGENELRFLNHSRNPNAEFRGASLYAVRNIQSGHEILIDYGDEWDDDEDHD